MTEDWKKTASQRILIIDDEPMIRRAMADYLAEYDYETVTAADGAEGLACARAEAFDVVLVDLRMPRLDGMEVISTLQAEHPEIPVVVVSGTGVLQDAVEAMRRGAWDYITKPVHDMDEIIVVIERVREKSQLLAERDRYQRDIEDLNRSLAAKVAQQTHDLRMRNRNLTVLNRVIAAASNTLDVEQILQVLCAELAIAFNLPQVTAAVIEAETGYAVFFAEYREPRRPSLLNIVIPLKQPALSYMLENQQPLFIANVQSDERLGKFTQLLHEHQTASMLWVPLVVYGNVRSFLSLESACEYTYAADDLDLIQSAAAAAAQALETTNLYQELQDYATNLEATVAQRTKELQIALKKARAADEAKSQFLSNVSHELRTPLTSIRLYLDLLESGREDQRQRYLESLSREAKRLQTLIEGLLTLSRLDVGKLQVQPREFSLNRLLRDLAADRKRLFDERNLALDVNLEHDLPTISADPKLMEQVATNLLTNAMYYTPGGGRVELQSEIRSQDGQTWVTFSVIDTGLGISEEEQTKLFERFYRGSAGQVSNAPGTGLGLAICKEIVNLHRGRITVESALGKGSIFTVWLPCQQ